MKTTTEFSPLSTTTPCTSYDIEARLAVIDGSEKQDITKKSIFFYTYYGNYGVEHTHDYWEFILILAGNYTHALNGRNFQFSVATTNCPDAVCRNELIHGRNKERRPLRDGGRSWKSQYYTGFIRATGGGQNGGHATFEEQ